MALINLHKALDIHTMIATISRFQLVFCTTRSVSNNIKQAGTKKHWVVYTTLWDIPVVLRRIIADTIILRACAYLLPQR